MREQRNSCTYFCTILYRSTLPFYRSTLPFYRSTLPFHRSTLPYHRCTVPFYRSTLPFYRSTLPFYRSTLPFYRSTLPFYRSTLPFYRSTLPIHDGTNSIQHNTEHYVKTWYVHKDLESYPCGNRCHISQTRLETKKENNFNITDITIKEQSKQQDDKPWTIQSHPCGNNATVVRTYFCTIHYLSTVPLYRSTVPLYRSTAAAFHDRSPVMKQCNGYSVRKPTRTMIKGTGCQGDQWDATHDGTRKWCGPCEEHSKKRAHLLAAQRKSGFKDNKNNILLKKAKIISSIEIPPPANPWGAKDDNDIYHPWAVEPQEVDKYFPNLPKIPSTLPRQDWLHMDTSTYYHLKRNGGKLYFHITVPHEATKTLHNLMEKDDKAYYGKKTYVGAHQKSRTGTRSQSDGFIDWTTIHDSTNVVKVSKIHEVNKGSPHEKVFHEVLEKIKSMLGLNKDPIGISFIRHTSNEPQALHADSHQTGRTLNVCVALRGDLTEILAGPYMKTQN